MNIISVLATELNIKPWQAEAAVNLIDEGNTIPFIARYRKEAHGQLDDQLLRKLADRLEYLRNLESKKEEISRLITEQEKMTDELAEKISKAVTISELDDIYRPFRPKRRTRAIIAKEKGLEPLAKIILEQKAKESPEALAAEYISEEKGVNTIEEALQGAKDIIAEEISDNADYRKEIKRLYHKTGTIVTKAKKEEDSVYRLYYDNSEPIKYIKSHRVLAINRGEKEDFLSVKINADRGEIISYLRRNTVRVPLGTASQLVIEATEDAFDRLIAPSVENEMRNLLTENAQTGAIEVFGENLKNLLLQPPVKNRVVMGFDPAYRTGCKIAVVNEMGDVLDTTVVYPTPPQNKTIDAERVLLGLIKKHNIDIISIGNGTASKESEIFVANMIKKADRPVSYMVVSESGASVYSASKLAAEEFPEFDVSLRSAVSIARRLQDPLAELVKIDPKAIGVGQYQHDCNPKQLATSLGGVVEYCVNNVGVDVNTASPSLLSYISGVSGSLAKNIYAYRAENGRFESRAQLKKVKGLGPKAFEQCAGFLRINGGKDVLDMTSVHPESYAAAKELLKILGYTLKDVEGKNLGDLGEKIKNYNMKELAEQLGIGEITLADIVRELQKPGLDPRDSLPQPVLRTDVLDIESLKPGMELVGTVRNVADFGAFVDIGVHQDGLVHISKLAKHRVNRAMDVVSVGDIINVRVLDVDVKKKRISLEKI
ncbi:MAG: RNA-binding transcriptional accessory protein [Ruminococcaceae bacterium]|nr:RNA-binding transcriptional accessory protein [Oscillospiraceae bacterium]